MKTVSVVIPIYNVQDYLTKCLNSLYDQLNDTIEVILVNDGSTDNSLEICRKYAEKYPNTIVIDKENGGLSDARNVGTEAASGEYIYYLDSDDWLAPGATFDDAFKVKRILTVGHVAQEKRTAYSYSGIEVTFW